MYASSHAQPAVTGYPYQQVPFTEVKLSAGSFWGNRLKAAKDVTIPLAFSKCQTEHRYDNFVKAAHPSDDYVVNKFMIFPFDDTDVYKTIEGASYILQSYPDKKLKNYIDSVLNIVGAAQEPDGYLYTARTMNPKHPHPWSGNKRWVQEEVLSHELYNLGHMLDAAVAHYQATGSKKFLDIARRYADCVVREVGPKPGQACVVPGHQIAEMGLAKLYLATGDHKYLDEAKFFLDYRGKTSIKNIYSQSDKSVTDQTEAWGHAVRAGYMYAGMADIAALTGDTAYVKAIDKIWENIVSKKYYLTGGVGARHEGEAFGADYELPNMTAYNETCAAIAQCYLNLRLFMLHGESKYIDCLERTLYNGVISGMSVDGGKFFYPNPLSSDGVYKFNSDGTTTRQPWFGCACCPSNLSRFIPSIPGYAYAVKNNNVYVNLFMASDAKLKVDGKDIELHTTTAYPWNGNINIKVVSNKNSKANMMIRIPGWIRNEVVPSDLYKFADNSNASWMITRNGKKVEATINPQGYVCLNNIKKGDNIAISFDMQPRTVVANNHVKDDKGLVAVERGPLVYCAEWADNTGVCIQNTFLRDTPTFKLINDYSIVNTEADGKPFKVDAITTDAQVLERNANGDLQLKNVNLTLIPYYAWNHRGAGQMNVWLQNKLK
jgi:Uncharacterized protein conserved in bacteria